MTQEQEQQTGLLSEQEKNVLWTLLYFDIFHYPLTEKEIGWYSPRALNEQWQTSLVSLVSGKYIYLLNGFYTLHEDRNLVTRRQAGNLLATKRMKEAQRFSSLIAHFPFVRSVMLSGSLSKGYMDEKSDIDYFIITAAGRLWIVRTALVLFRRIFLFNSRKYFCTNYFIDHKNLEIQEKNIFTAVEASTLKPMFGKKYVYSFQAANRWCSQFLPNHQPENGLGEERDGVLKKVSEKLLSGKWLDSIDRWLMKKSIAHWENRYRNLLNDKDFSIAFQSTASASRSHPEFYQKKVLSLYAQKISEFEKKHSLNLQS